MQSTKEVDDAAHGSDSTLLSEVERLICEYITSRFAVTPSVQTWREGSRSFVDVTMSGSLPRGIGQELLAYDFEVISNQEIEVVLQLLQYCDEAWRVYAKYEVL